MTVNYTNNYTFSLITYFYIVPFIHAKLKIITIVRYISLCNDVHKASCMTTQLKTIRMFYQLYKRAFLKLSHLILYAINIENVDIFIASSLRIFNNKKILYILNDNNL